MIPLTLGEIAAITAGRVTGDPATIVAAPASFDSRQVDPGGLFVAFAGENVDGHDFARQAAQVGAAAVLGSRATDLPTVIVADVQDALQALAREVVARLRDELTVVAVTGSQGKTSTKDLVSAVLSTQRPTIATAGNFNNGLGVPITMLRADHDTRYMVLEMGARHVGDIARLTALVAPDVAIVTNVGKAHIGEFGSRDAIARGKGEIVEGLAPGGTAVLNADDHRVRAMRELTDARVITYGRADDADVRVRNLRLDPLGRPTFELRTADASAGVALPLIGTHQAANAAAAAAAASALGVPLATAAEALGAATLSPGRMEVRELDGGATLLNDSYNSSPGSVRSSLDALASIAGRRRIAVLGEILELGARSASEHRAAGRYAARRADLVVAVGENTRPLAEGAGERGIVLADNDAAIQWLRGTLAPGDVVLVKASRGARIDLVADALA
jgi:UDP-N-acetylmuramoyl-tripeptide--D-alanyl-D-alanine ligase